MIEEGAVIPRLMTVDGIAMSIENGAGRDMLSSGLATLADETVGREQFALTRAGYQLVIATIGREALEGAGVLVPRLEAKEQPL